MLSIVSIWLTFAGIAIETYQTAWRDADLFATDVASLLEQGIARDIEVYDLSLQALANAAANPVLHDVSPEVRRLALFDQSANASGMGAMLLVGKDGNVLLQSRGTTPPGINLADRAYFIAQRNGTAGVQPYVSHPLYSRITQAYAIMLSRPRRSPTGAFEGVVCGTITIDYIDRLFASVPLPPGSVITLMHRDGTLLARAPRIGDLGLGLKAPVLFDAIQNNKPGPFVLRSVFDGVERRVAYHQAGKLPVYISVGLSTKAFLGIWRWRLEMIGLGFLVLSAIIVFLGVMLTRELNRRTQAERELSTLAATDSLTMLANRRRFDEVLQLEWRRAIREATPLSLLMMDGDAFKAFNDTYGHVSGDRALRQIADALQGAVRRRPGDLVARFGGEEFVALLPGTDRDGAIKVAETIRRAILDLAVPHAGSPLGVLTLSIGAASRRPRHQEEVATLLEAADRALYAAKAIGRGHIIVEESIEGTGHRASDRVGLNLAVS